jgi:hypothetical protein
METTNSMTPIEALQYDSKLSLDIKLDGSKVIIRKSPFNAQKTHDIKEFRHTFLGSGRWIRDMLIKMDTQRKSIVHDALQNNKKIRAKRHDSMISREVAEMMDGGGDTFIN